MSSRSKRRAERARTPNAADPDRINARTGRW